MRKILLALLICISSTSIYLLYTRMDTSSFPPNKISCFDSFLEERNTRYSDPSYNLPQFSMENISYFRCASAIGFSQYEIRGIDATGQMFAIIRASGGKAASGADGYFEYCRIEDGKVIRSEKLVGRSTRSTSSCVYVENFPQNPISSYTYIR